MTAVSLALWVARAAAQDCPGFPDPAVLFDEERALPAAAAGTGRLADLDRDGDLDLPWAAAGGDGAIGWLENLGDGSFASHDVARLPASRQQSAADLDGDGDLDLVASSSADDRVAWFENTGGGVFGPDRTLAWGIPGAGGFALADVDGDGDVDLGVAAPSSQALYVVEGLGRGRFAAPVLLFQSTRYAPFDVVLADDVDGDGLDDLLATGVYANELRTFVWSGTGFGFRNRDRIGTYGATWAALGDLDADGDEDLVFPSRLASRIYWSPRAAGGGFAAATDLAAGPWGVGNVAPRDLDEDGDLDLAAAGLLDNVVAWLENDGAGGWSAVRPVGRTLAGALEVVDLDRDGHLDLVGGTGWEPSGLPPDRDRDGTCDPLDADRDGDGLDDDAEGALGTSPDAADTDADGLADGGDPDPLAPDTDLDDVWDGDERGIGGDPQEADTDGDGLDDGVERALGSDPASDDTDGDGLSDPGDPCPSGNDLDDDGVCDPDDRCAGGDDDTDDDGDRVPDACDDCPDAASSGPFGPPVPIAPVGRVHSLAFADFDGDGADDLVVGADRGPAVAPGRRGDGLGPLATIPSAFVAGWTAPADVDFDGDADLLSLQWFDVVQVWTWDRGAFAPARAYGAPRDPVTGVVADLDGDGGDDLVVAGKDLTWIRAPSRPIQRLDARELRWTAVVAFDADGDGDLDVAGTNGSGVAWFANDGAGRFTSARVASRAEGGTALVALDADDDGDADLVHATSDGVAFLENRGDSFRDPVALPSPDAVRGLLPGDLDGDGDRDVLVHTEDGLSWYRADRGLVGPLPALADPDLSAVTLHDVDGDGVDDLVAVTRDRLEWRPGGRAVAPDLDGDGDCDSQDADADGDGVGARADCDDLDPRVAPGRRAPPGDGVDQDCDGADGVAEPPATDTGDPAPCCATPTEPAPTDRAADGEGCGCAADGGSGPLHALGLLGALALRRRRR